MLRIVYSNEGLVGRGNADDSSDLAKVEVPQKLDNRCECGSEEGKEPIDEGENEDEDVGEEVTNLNNQGVDGSGGSHADSRNGQNDEVETSGDEPDEGSDGEGDLGEGNDGASESEDNRDGVVDDKLNFNNDVTKHNDDLVEDDHNDVNIDISFERNGCLQAGNDRGEPDDGNLEDFRKSASMRMVDLGLGRGRGTINRAGIDLGGCRCVTTTREGASDT
jgi:hypothetical protein